MTIADFLHQAGFWQWVGMLLIACALGEIRLVSFTKKKKMRLQERGDAMTPANLRLINAAKAVIEVLLEHAVVHKSTWDSCQDLRAAIDAAEAEGDTRKDLLPYSATLEDIANWLNIIRYTLPIEEDQKLQAWRNTLQALSVLPAPPVTPAGEEVTEAAARDLTSSVLSGTVDVLYDENKRLKAEVAQLQAALAKRGKS